MNASFVLSSPRDGEHIDPVFVPLVPLPPYRCSGIVATMKREFPPSIPNKPCPFQHDVILDGLIMEAVYWILCSCSCEWCTLVHAESQPFSGLLGRRI